MIQTFKFHEPFFLGQLKEAKEATNKSKKEIGKLQREYNLLAKYAKQWGKMIKEQGNLSVGRLFFMLNFFA